MIIIFQCVKEQHCNGYIYYFFSRIVKVLFKRLNTSLDGCFLDGCSLDGYHFADFEQVQKVYYFAVFWQFKKDCYFAVFGQVKNIFVFADFSQVTWVALNCKSVAVNQQ